MKHNAILFGASGGIGRSLQNKLENSSSVNKLICFSRSINTDEYNIDYNDEKTIQKAANYIQPKNFNPTLIIIATGILSDDNNRPETQIKQFSTEWAQKNYLLNAIGPALIAKYFLPLMPRDKDIYFATLSAKVGSISDNELGGWYSYRASKAALNMLIKNLSIEWQRKNKKTRIIAMHPGTVDTSLSKPYQKNVKPEKLFSSDRAAEQILDILLNSTPDQSGSLISWDGKAIEP